VSISEKNSLNEDLVNTSVVIYWGTTVSLEALGLGIPVIHYQREHDYLSYDPIFSCPGLHWNVNSGDDLSSVLKKITNIESKEYEKQKNLSDAYIDKYFLPVNDENMSQFLF
jgi:predicted glycosyltransferase